MKNKVKRLLQNRNLTIGSWLTFDHTSVAEIMAKAGFDWIVVDMEHSAIGIAEAQHLIQVIELCGCVPLVRLSSNDQVLIKRVMDAGAYGIIVPMVNTVQDAQKAIAAIRYPLSGTRGVGLARAQGYGAEFEKYLKSANKESIVIAQIEHKIAVENIDQILSVDGIDGIIIGPYDLSGSYGIPGQFKHILMKKAEQKILKAVEKSGKVAGIHVVHPSISDCKRRIKEGFRFVAFGVDMIFLGDQCRNAVKCLKQ